MKNFKESWWYMLLWGFITFGFLSFLDKVEPSIVEQECDHTFVHGRYCIERILQPEDITEDHLYRPENNRPSNIPVDYCYDCGTLRVNVKYRKP